MYIYTYIALYAFTLLHEPSCMIGDNTDPDTVLVA
jgi:hypothetical protein